MKITQFTMEEVRCFAERQTLEIRPLTFLVGENSTGKTTALSCFQVLAECLRGRGIDFNLPPYAMGSFKDIVRNSKKKEKNFELGFTYEHADEVIEWTVGFAQEKESINPNVNSLIIKFVDGEIVFKMKEDIKEHMCLTSFDERRNRYRIDCLPGLLTVPLIGVDNLRFFTDPSEDILKGNSEGKIALAKYLGTHENSKGKAWQPWDILGASPIFSISPVRSRPKRTYDPMREFNDPEGSDIPMFLMRVEATQQKEWEKLKTQLVEFGKSSGLFQNIEVRNFGRALGTPFQLKFKVKGPNANIVDVGYGVSQILPILVQVLKSDPSETTYFLLQQPEVHLHPKAQAELSSLLAQLANEGNRSFIVETHSDYMLDRARIEIIRGNIRPEDVSLIYFEPKGRIVKVHNISFDKMANMVGVPPHYGEFFLKESKRLLGFKD